MSLNDAMSADTAKKIEELDVADIVALVRCLSLGFGPEELHAGAERVAAGEIVPVPSRLGLPNPLKINAWSFVNDHGQYADTYGLTDAEAGTLKGLLRTDVEKGIAEITRVVTAALTKRGSNKPVAVSRDGMPGAGKTDHHPAPGKQGGTDLTAEITRNPTLYGMYKFAVEDTGRAGPLRYRVRLGNGLYATFPSKRGAIDVARICAVNGRNYEVIAGRVVFWRNGKTPVSGPDIPSKVPDGKSAPGEALAPDPVDKADTVAPGNGKGIGEPSK